MKYIYLFAYICEIFAFFLILYLFITMSGKNYINKLKLERERGPLWRCLCLSKKIPLMHVQLENTSNWPQITKCHIIKNHNLNTWYPLLKKGRIYFIYSTLSPLPKYASTKSITSWFKNIKTFSVILPCHIHKFSSKTLMSLFTFWYPVTWSSITDLGFYFHSIITTKNTKQSKTQSGNQDTSYKNLIFSWTKVM